MHRLIELGDITQAARYFLSSTFAIPPICINRYFTRAVQDRVDGLGDITLLHCFCTATWWEITVCVIEGSIVKFFVSMRELWLDGSVMDAF